MINVLFTIDGRFSQHLGVCIASLLLSNPSTMFRLIVASPSPIDPQALANLQTIVKLGNAKIEYVVHDAASDYEHLPFHSHLPPIVYLRLFMTEYVDPTISKLIFLDCDVIICENISALWEIDVGDAYIGAAPEPYDERQRTPLGFGAHDLYVNAGVMLVNLERWRADDVLPKLLEFANSHQRILYSLDQDIMNCVFRGRIVNIGYMWNWQALCPRFTAEELGLSAEEFAQLRSSPRIVHYTSRYKPWYFRWQPHYKYLYHKALQETPWAGYIPPDRKLRNIPVKLFKTLQQKIEWYFPKMARELRVRFKMST